MNKMAFKFVVFAACVAIARGGVLSQPLAYSSIAAPLSQVHYQQAPQQLAYSSIAAPLSQIQYQQAPLAYAAGAAPIAYQRGIGAPLASVFRVDHPLGPQRAPAQIARYAPIAPLQTAHFAQAPIAAPLAAAPVVHSIAAPAAHLAKTVVAEEYDPNPQYSYSYDVQDALTGDSKNQFESRNGDVVQGSYSLNDADGTRRIVEYTADPINGFNAVVHKKPLAVAAPVAVAGPTIAKIHAPIGIAQSPIDFRSAIIH